jgi:hypothetical protein
MLQATVLKNTKSYLEIYIYHTVGTIPKSNIIIVERGTIDTHW